MGSYELTSVQKNDMITWFNEEHDLLQYFKVLIALEVEGKKYDEKGNVTGYFQEIIILCQRILESIELCKQKLITSIGEEIPSDFYNALRQYVIERAKVNPESMRNIPDPMLDTIDNKPALSTSVLNTLTEMYLLACDKEGKVAQELIRNTISSENILGDIHDKSKIFYDMLQTSTCMDSKYPDDLRKLVITAKYKVAFMDRELRDLAFENYFEQLGILRKPSFRSTLSEPEQKELLLLMDKVDDVVEKLEDPSDFKKREVSRTENTPLEVLTQEETVCYYASLVTYGFVMPHEESKKRISKLPPEEVWTYKQIFETENPITQGKNIVMLALMEANILKEEDSSHMRT